MRCCCVDMRNYMNFFLFLFPFIYSIFDNDDLHCLLCRPLANDPQINLLAGEIDWKKKKLVLFSYVKSDTKHRLSSFIYNVYLNLIRLIRKQNSMMTLWNDENCCVLYVWSPLFRFSSIVLLVYLSMRWCWRYWEIYFFPLCSAPFFISLCSIFIITKIHFCCSHAKLTVDVLEISHFV